MLLVRADFPHSVLLSRKSQAELSSTLVLHSSATLGTGKVATHQELLDKHEDKEVRRVMDGRTRGKRRAPFSGTAVSDEESDDDLNRGAPMKDDASEIMDIDEDAGKSRENPVVIVDADAGSLGDQETSVPAAVGSALRRNADGSMATPRMLKRKDKGTRVRLNLFI